MYKCTQFLLVLRLKKKKGEKKKKTEKKEQSINYPIILYVLLLNQCLSLQLEPTEKQTKKKKKRKERKKKKTEKKEKSINYPNI